MQIAKRQGGLGVLQTKKGTLGKGRDTRWNKAPGLHLFLLAVDAQEAEEVEAEEEHQGGGAHPADHPAGGPAPAPGSQPRGNNEEGRQGW